MTKYQDFPFNEAYAGAADLMKRGMTVHQKFSCEKCGERLMVEKPNVFYMNCTCECGHVTDVTKRGCNYLVMGDLGDFMNIQPKG